MNRGDIWHVNLDPTIGKEQANARYVLVLTQREFNNFGTPIIAPITTGGTFSRIHGFTVSLSGAGTDAAGVILCNQMRAIDIKGRGGKFHEKAPSFIVNEVLAKIAAILE